MREDPRVCVVEVRLGAVDALPAALPLHPPTDSRDAVVVRVVQPDAVVTVVVAELEDC